MKRTRKKTGDKKNMYTTFLNDNKHFCTFNGQTKKNEKKKEKSVEYISFSPPFLIFQIELIHE